GFSAANNIAIRTSQAPYVLVLNPDTRVTAGALDGVLEVMEARPEVGIVGCRLELENGALDHAAKRSFPTPLGALAPFTGVGRRRGLRLNFAFHHGMYRFYRKHYAATRAPVVNTAIYLGVVVKFCVSSARAAGGRAVEALRMRRRRAIPRSP